MSYDKKKFVPLDRKPWSNDSHDELKNMVKAGKSLAQIREAFGKSSFEVIAEIRDVSGSVIPLQDSDLNHKYQDQSLTMRQVAPSRFSRWNPNEEEQLLYDFINRKDIKAIANRLQRTATGCWDHLQVMANKDCNILQKLFGAEVFHTRCKKMISYPKYYRHFKGGKYKALMEGKDSESQEPVVIYQALYGEHGIWVRPKTMFYENVKREGYCGPRFTEITEEEAFS